MRLSNHFCLLFFRGLPSSGPFLCQGPHCNSILNHRRGQYERLRGFSYEGGDSLCMGNEARVLYPS